MNFAKSIMIGNNLSDMQFGKNAGMHTVLVETTQKITDPNVLIDVVLPDLEAFGNLLL